MKNAANYVVLDLETGGKNPERHEVLEVAAKAYDGRTLQPFPPETGGEFRSLMRPLRPDDVEADALAVNGLTREEIAAAPDQRIIWRDFAAWVSRWKNEGGNPILGGKNIRDFDMLFIEKLNAAHGKVPFRERRQLELEDVLFWWFESTDELPGYGLDAVRDYFGMTREKGHTALQDARQTGELLMRFLRLHRELRSRRAADGSPFIKFHNSMKGTGK